MSFTLVQKRNRKLEAELKLDALNVLQINNDLLNVDCPQTRYDLKCPNFKQCCKLPDITIDVLVRFRKQLWDPINDMGTPLIYRKCKLLQLLIESAIDLPGMILHLKYSLLSLQ